MKTLFNLNTISGDNLKTTLLILALSVFTSVLYGNCFKNVDLIEKGPSAEMTQQTSWETLILLEQLYEDPSLELSMAGLDQLLKASMLKQSLVFEKSMPLPIVTWSKKCTNMTGTKVFFSVANQLMLMFYSNRSLSNNLVMKNKIANVSFKINLKTKDLI